jgi:hypothetical protein
MTIWARYSSSDSSSTFWSESFYLLVREFLPFGPTIPRLYPPQNGTSYIRSWLPVPFLPDSRIAPGLHPARHGINGKV